MLRLFIAVDLPPEVKKAVAALCCDVNNARWVNRRQMHVTLRFLGATAEAQLPEIHARLSGLREPGFGLSVCGAGTFSGGQGRKPPRVLWLGLEPSAPLLRLMHAIERALGLNAEAERKESSPHLTLARFPKVPDRTLADFLARHQSYRSAEWSVRQFALFKSTLQSGGSIHELVSNYPLVATDSGG